MRAAGTYDWAGVVAETPPLLKARIGETVRVDLPRGTKRFAVMAIL